MPYFKAEIDTFTYGREQERWFEVKQKELATALMVGELLPVVEPQLGRRILRLARIQHPVVPPKWTTFATHNVRGLPKHQKQGVFLSTISNRSACLFTRAVTLDLDNGIEKPIGPMLARAVLSRDGGPVLGSDSPILAINADGNEFYLQHMSLAVREKFVETVMTAVNLIQAQPDSVRAV